MAKLTLQELQELDVAFVSLTEAFDLTTPTGRAMAAMVAVFAEFEREIRSERVRAGMSRPVRRAGHWADLGQHPCERMRCASWRHKG